MTDTRKEEAADIVERLEACRHGLFWPEARDAAEEIATLRQQIEESRERNLIANERADNAEAVAAKARAMALEEAAADVRGFWKGDDTREFARGWNACCVAISDHLDEVRALSAPQGREG